MRLLKLPAAPPPLSAPIRVAIAPLAVLLAVAVQYASLPHPAIAPFVFFYFTVALTSLVCGRLPGLIAVALSALAANYLFIEPYGALSLSGPALTAALLFLISSGAIALLCSSYRGALLEAQRSEQRFRDLAEALRETDRRKNDFLAILSHELRNPLAPIRNSLHILDRAAPGGEQAKRALAILDRQVAHLSRLVDDLLDVVRITRNVIQLRRERFDLVELAKRTIEDHRGLFEENGVSLEAACSRDPVLVDGDRARIAQALGNLLQNAAKFTGRGGSARVTVEADPAEARAVIRVTDTGPGIGPAALAGLFKPFMQDGAPLNRDKGGLGLGLAIAKGLVELHGGDLSARSEGPGRGAEFVMRLPLDETGAAEPRTEGSPVSTRGRRVLVIEDNVDAAETLKEVLELGMNQVAVAHSGQEGLVTARAFRPEVVFCDIGMPGMDGYEVARAFRADPALGTVVLIALSGYAQPSDRVRAAEVGFASLLAKPADPRKIEELLAELPVRYPA